MSPQTGGPSGGAGTLRPRPASDVYTWMLILSAAMLATATTIVAVHAHRKYAWPAGFPAPEAAVPEEAPPAEF